MVLFSAIPVLFASSLLRFFIFRFEFERPMWTRFRRIEQFNHWIESIQLSNWKSISKKLWGRYWMKFAVKSLRFAWKGLNDFVFVQSLYWIKMLCSSDYFLLLYFHKRKMENPVIQTNNRIPKWIVLMFHHIQTSFIPINSANEELQTH